MHNRSHGFSEEDWDRADAWHDAKCDRIAEQAPAYSDIETYPEMNEKIVWLLRMTPDNPVPIYAAARIEELEAERERLRGLLLDYRDDHDYQLGGSECNCDLCEQAGAVLGQ